MGGGKRIRWVEEEKREEREQSECEVKRKRAQVQEGRWGKGERSGNRIGSVRIRVGMMWESRERLRNLGEYKGSKK